MSIGFYLLGQFKTAQLKPNKALRRIEKWLKVQCSGMNPVMRIDFLEEKPCLFANLHPAGEEIEICVPDPDHITVAANTSTVGPGYHIFLCDLIRRWADDFSITWTKFDKDADTTFGDETDYFFSGDKQRVYGEMSYWLQALAGSFFDGTLDGDAKEIALCMPMNVRFRANSLAITQLGPRDKEWLHRLSKGMIHDREFFPWYETGLGAEYYLGRALVHIWSDIRWRKPVNKTETKFLSSVLRSLEVAHSLNATLQFPWNEWNEIYSLVDEKAPNFVKANAMGGGEMGYRRGLVRTCLPGNWWIETEGSFSSFQGGRDGALAAYDPPREVWFTAYSFSAENPEATFHMMADKARSENRELVYEKDKYISVARITRGKGGEAGHYVLQASNIGILCRSVTTLVFATELDREWAIRVWKSIEPPSPARSGS